MQGKIIVSFLKCITSYYRHCNLQRNSEALKSKITHTYLCTYTRAHTHTTHEEHWHIHNTYTFARARAGRYSSCTQQRHSLTHTLCTQHTKKIQRHKYLLTHFSLTHTEKQHIVTKQACPIRHAGLYDGLYKLAHSFSSCYHML